ncbi:hypothetical protein KCU87_g107, partial [Aureobasidium melanogenum]
MNSPQAAAITGRRPTTSAKCPARGDASKASNEVLLVIADKSNVVNGRPRSSCIETRVELMTPVLSDVLLLLRYNRKGQTVRTGDGHPSRSPGYRLLCSTLSDNIVLLLMLDGMVIPMVRRPCNLSGSWRRRRIIRKISKSRLS